MEHTLKPMVLRILDVKFLFFSKVNINLGLERVHTGSVRKMGFCFYLPHKL